MAAPAAVSMAPLTVELWLPGWRWWAFMRCRHRGGTAGGDWSHGTELEQLSCAFTAMQDPCDCSLPHLLQLIHGQPRAVEYSSCLRNSRCCTGERGRQTSSGRWGRVGSDGTDSSTPGISIALPLKHTLQEQCRSAAEGAGGLHSWPRLAAAGGGGGGIGGGTSGGTLRAPPRPIKALLTCNNCV